MQREPTTANTRFMEVPLSEHLHVMGVVIDSTLTALIGIGNAINVSRPYLAGHRRWRPSRPAGVRVAPPALMLKADTQLLPRFVTYRNQPAVLWIPMAHSKLVACQARERCTPHLQGSIRIRARLGYFQKMAPPMTVVTPTLGPPLLIELKPPTPNCPNPLLPQHSSEPSTTSAQLWARPLDSATTR